MRSKGIAGYARRAPTEFKPRAYVLEQLARGEWIALSYADTVEPLMRGIREKRDVRILRTKDQVVVWQTSTLGSESP